MPIVSSPPSGRSSSWKKKLASSFIKLSGKRRWQSNSYWTMNAQLDYDEKVKAIGGDLSKQAKKDWLLRHKDQGLER
ncbi:hypothetical protein ACN92M_26590 (plasmid) [Paenibacillus polymyxa]|uniref:hypothetical protein n=1 Tax=Paenibacillus polymyxa TaxID=1406 RepID=UPI003B595B30